MRKISDTNAIMDVVVNPFTREVIITHKTKRETYELSLTFEDIDEWQGFDTDKQYDAHFLYEEGEGFSFEIYPVIADKSNGKPYVRTDTTKSIPINLDITLDK